MHYDQKAVHRSIFVMISITIPKMFDTYSFLTFSSQDKSLDSTDECIVFRDESLVSWEGGNLLLSSNVFLQS